MIAEQAHNISVILLQLFSSKCGRLDRDLKSKNIFGKRYDAFIPQAIGHKYAHIRSSLLSVVS